MTRVRQIAKLDRADALRMAEQFRAKYSVEPKLRVTPLESVPLSARHAVADFREKVELSHASWVDAMSRSDKRRGIEIAGGQVTGSKKVEASFAVEFQYVAAAERLISDNHMIPVWNGMRSRSTSEEWDKCAADFFTEILFRHAMWSMDPLMTASERTEEDRLCTEAINVLRTHLAHSSVPIDVEDDLDDLLLQALEHLDLGLGRGKDERWLPDRVRSADGKELRGGARRTAYCRAMRLWMEKTFDRPLNTLVALTVEVWTGLPTTEQDVIRSARRKTVTEDSDGRPVVAVKRPATKAISPVPPGSRLSTSAEKSPKLPSQD